MGKSTLARLIAREYAAAGWNVKIGDLDIAQGTSFNWQSRRLQHQVEPVIAVERFGTVEQALKVAPQYDMLILDGRLLAHCAWRRGPTWLSRLPDWRLMTCSPPSCLHTS